MGLPTDDHMSRAGHAEGTELLIVWLSQMNACSCAMPYVSHRGRRVRGDLSGVIRRGVIRRGVIAWRPVFVSVGVLFVGVSFYGTLSLCQSGRHCMAPR